MVIGSHRDGLNHAVVLDGLGKLPQLGFVKRLAGVGGGLVDCVDGEKLSPLGRMHGSSYIDCPVREPIQPAPQPRTPAPKSAPNRPGMASWKRPDIIRMPAKMRPPKQMTAPA